MTEGKAKKKIFDGRYDILSIVGRGACSVVYHARHASPPVSDVALKVLLNKKGERANTDRLRKEALAMVSSRHRYVIRLDDFHSVGDLCYLSMEYAPESDLRKFAASKGGTLDLIRAERFLLQATEALGFIHRAGIIHRDIKPDNILVMNENEIRLGDFGVAVLPGEESSLDELQRGVGTMDYMAPEVLDGTRYDQRSDVFALGVTFYELLSGKHPFAGAPLMEQLEVRKEGRVAHVSTLVSGIPAYLANVIMRAMSFDREQRYPTGREMLQAILVGKSEGDKAGEKQQRPASPAAQQRQAEPKPQQVAPQAKAPPAAQPKARIDLPSKPEPKSAAAAESTQPKPVAAKPAQQPPTAPKTRPVAATPLQPPVRPDAKRELTPLTPAPTAASAAPSIEPSPVVEAPKAHPEKAIPQKATPPSARAPEPDFAESSDDDTQILDPVESRESKPLKEASNNDAPGRERRDTGDMPKSGSSLPGIGLKSEPPVQVPTVAVGGVRLKDSSRRETVTVPPSEVGVTRELSNARPTVTIPSEQRPGNGGLAAAAILGADAEEERHTPTVGFAGNALVKQIPGRADAEAGRSEGQVQGIQGKFKKLNDPAKRNDSKKNKKETKKSMNAAMEETPLNVGLIKKLVIGVLGIATLFVGLSVMMNTPTGKKIRGAATSVATTSNNPDAQGIPAVTAESIQFPALPEGMYAGKISGLTPGSEVPLSIVSLPNQHAISFIVGIPGWTPTLIEYPETEDAEEGMHQSLEVASNGFILQVTGQVVDGTLTGFFRNLVNGEEGQWNAAPVRGAQQ